MKFAAAWRAAQQVDGLIVITGCFSMYGFLTLWYNFDVTPIRELGVAAAVLTAERPPQRQRRRHRHHQRRLSRPPHRATIRISHHRSCSGADGVQPVRVVQPVRAVRAVRLPAALTVDSGLGRRQKVPRQAMATRRRPGDLATASRPGERRSSVAGDRLEAPRSS